MFFFGQELIDVMTLVIEILFNMKLIVEYENVSIIYTSTLQHNVS